MTKQHLLLVDGDSRSLRTTEASLRSAGFVVSVARDGQDAFDRCRAAPPDLVVSETRLPQLDGFELCKKLKADRALSDIPFMFLTGHRSVEEKIRGLELGAEDYLTSPIDRRELVARIRVTLEKRQKERATRRDQRASLSGSLADMSIADLVQTLEVGRKSGTIEVEDDQGHSGTIWLQAGRVIDATSARLRGEGAFHRLLRWHSGRFAVELGAVQRPQRIAVATQHLLLEGMRRIDEWQRALADLPGLDTVLQIDYPRLSDRLAEIPDDVNAMLKLVDGRRTLGEVVSDSENDDLVTASAIAMLHREGILVLRPATTSELVGPVAPAMTPAGAPAAVAAAPEAEAVDWLAGPSTAEAPPAHRSAARREPPPLGTPSRSAEPAEPTSDAPDDAASPGDVTGAMPPRIVRFASKQKDLPKARVPVPVPVLAPVRARRGRAWAAGAVLAVVMAALLLAAGTWIAR